MVKVVNKEHQIKMEMWNKHLLKPDLLKNECCAVEHTIKWFKIVLVRLSDIK